MCQNPTLEQGDPCHTSKPWLLSDMTGFEDEELADHSSQKTVESHLPRVVVKQDQTCIHVPPGYKDNRKTACLDKREATVFRQVTWMATTPSHLTSSLCASLRLCGAWEPREPFPELPQLGPNPGLPHPRSNPHRIPSGGGLAARPSSLQQTFP